MVQLGELIDYCDALLEVDSYRDYCPNGLQVEGRNSVRKIISGVTACQALIDAAVDADADLLLVHHGYFWKGEEPSIVGMKQRRIKTLLDHDLNLVAYHLPLDGHPELGNNAQLGQLLKIPVSGRFLDGDLGYYGVLDTPIAIDTLAKSVESALGREPLVIEAGDKRISKVAWCSGAAQGYIEQAAQLGADAYISGEVSENTVHAARELGIHYIAAGHHATERYGVQKLGEHLSEHFGIEHRFIDIPNPV